jgi:hypothetical protein
MDFQKMALEELNEVNISKLSPIEQDRFFRAQSRKVTLEMASRITLGNGNDPIEKR